MPDRIPRLVCFALVALPLSVTACQRTPDEDQLSRLDNQITGNQADPALTSALEDPILTDPALSQRSNRNAVRPADGPVQAQYPPGGKAGRGSAAADHREMQAVAHGEGTGCGARLDYDRAWARRMPAAFPVFPGARITEAAGNDSGDCRMRVVTFTSDAPPQRVLDWYRQRAASAGYTADQERRDREQVLAGINQSDDGAYYLIVTPVARGGSDVALIANNGS
jgi:hypothetical protein